MVIRNFKSCQRGTLHTSNNRRVCPGSVSCRTRSQSPCPLLVHIKLHSTTATSQCNGPSAASMGSARSRPHRTPFPKSLLLDQDLAEEYAWKWKSINRPLITLCTRGPGISKLHHRISGLLPISTAGRTAHATLSPRHSVTSKSFLMAAARKLGQALCSFMILDFGRHDLLPT